MRYRSVVICKDELKASLLTARHFAEVDELRVRLETVAGGEVAVLVALV